MIEQIKAIIAKKHALQDEFAERIKPLSEELGRLRGEHHKQNSELQYQLNRLIDDDFKKSNRLG